MYLLSETAVKATITARQRLELLIGQMCSMLNDPLKKLSAESNRHSFTAGICEARITTASSGRNKKFLKSKPVR